MGLRESAHIIDHARNFRGHSGHFTLLLVPTVMGIRLFSGLGKQMIYTLAIGIVAVLIGSAASYILDLPTGAAIVCAFGLLLGTQVIIENFMRGSESN